MKKEIEVSLYLVALFLASYIGVFVSLHILATPSGWGWVW